MREGRDFATPEELLVRAGAERVRVVLRGAGERLARAVGREMDWLSRCGSLPGGPAWDDQPAWRVRLWEYCLAERERVWALAAGMA